MSPEGKPKSYALLYLLSGLFAGILIGFGTALIIQDRPISDMVPLFQQEGDTLGAMAGDIPLKARPKNHDLPSDTLGREAEGISLADAADGDGQDSLEVPVSGDTSNFYPGEGEPDIVRRDELVGTRRIKVATDQEAADKKQGGATTDSLLTSLTSVKYPGEYREYYVEFWRNPLNYLGYKLVKDRITLFGLSPEQSYKLVYDGNRLVLKTPKLSYPLRETTEFLPLIPQKKK